MDLLLISLRPHKALRQVTQKWRWDFQGVASICLDGAYWRFKRERKQKPYTALGVQGQEGQWLALSVAQGSQPFPAASTWTQQVSYVQVIVIWREKEIGSPSLQAEVLMH